jgi:hypothetical protein
MSDFDWRKWVWERLVASASLKALVPEERIFGAGSVVGDPSVKPFLVVTFGPKTDSLNDGGASVAHAQLMLIWAYDDPGSYAAIDNIQGLVRDALVGQVEEPSAICCEWQGESGDLADDTYSAIARNSSFRLVGGS